MTNASIWNDHPEYIEMLKALVADHFSGGTITRKINEKHGTTFTRNAIIGKATRLGLHLARPKNGTARPKGSDGGLGRRLNRIRQAVSAEQPVVKRAPLSPKPAAPTLDYLCRFEDLNNYTCRFPMWGHASDAPLAEKFFCGTPTADVAEGRSYCSHHARLCRSVQQERRSRPYFREAAE